MRKVFVQPILTDNWGYLETTVGDKKIERDEWDGRRVTVRWPDGTTGRVIVTFRRNYERVSDHGTATDAVSWVPCFTWPVHGKPVQFDLHEVEVKV